MRIEIDGAHSGIRFSACHFISGHEKCDRLHGHTYIVRLALEGDVGADGMVMDFVQLKRAIRSIADELDHRVLLPTRSDRVTVDMGDQVEVLSGKKRYSFPVEDVIVLDVIQTSAEELARIMLDKLLERVDMPSNVHEVMVGIDEERGQTAWYGKAFDR